MSLLAVEHLSIALPPGGDRAHAVEDVSFTLEPGRVLCLVGESGSGKSVSAGAIMGLLPQALRPQSGTIRFEGEDLLAATPARLRSLRGARIGMVFQEPMTVLNPLMRIGDQIGEMLLAHRWAARALGPVKARIAALLEAVHLPDPGRIARAYPHALSGGQRQRVMIAMAMALEPSLLIADEPTTALDVTTQMQILRLLADLQRRRGTAVLFITHDFGVVAEIADDVAVMRHGRIVEQGTARQVLAAPAHPYTQSLIAAALHEGAPRIAAAADAAELLGVERLCKTYARAGIFTRTRARRALDSVSLSLRRGETYGLVGESGSGKSTLARSIVRLVQPEAGAIRLAGVDLRPLGRAAWKPFRKRVQMVFQDPFASLNPRMRVGEAIAAGPIAHGMARAAALARAADLLALVQLDPAAAQRFPHEFSGGQRQRIGIARALALEPELLIADEPVSALDVSVQAQILALLEDLRVRLGLTMLFITHDLRIAAQICDRVAVMRNGAIVEEGVTAQVFSHPAHAYTAALLDSVPGRNWRQGGAHG
ncbi:MAG: ABC transporter ATP-binding protein [Rhodospirillales bacterium]|nr:ABC transporter ATP-binding protein [Rhodospirillales bacterium]